MYTTAVYTWTTRFEQTAKKLRYLDPIDAELVLVHPQDADAAQSRRRFTEDAAGM